ncbi:MAG: hypothetical protein AAF512_20220, partial [Pseudomonadota bacterium]
YKTIYIMILIRFYTFLIGVAFLFPVALHGTQNEEEQKIAQLLQLIGKQKTAQKKADLINNALKDKTNFTNGEFWKGLREACKNDTAVIEHLVVPKEYALEILPVFIADDDDDELVEFRNFIKEISLVSEKFARSLAKAVIKNIEIDDEIEPAFKLLDFLIVHKDGPKIDTKDINMSFDLIKKGRSHTKVIAQFYLDHPKKFGELIMEPWNRKKTRDLINIITKIIGTPRSNRYTTTIKNRSAQNVSTSSHTAFIMHY